MTEAHGSGSTQEVRQSVFVAHGGGLGDLVLASDAIGSIKRAHPEWHVTLACKAGFADVPNLYPVRPDEVLPIELDPHQWSAPSEGLLDALRPVVAGLKDRSVDLYVAAEMQPTWFAWLLASVFRPRRSLCCTRVQEETGFLSLLRERLGVKAVEVERVGMPEETHELRRYELLLDALSIPARSSFPWRRNEPSSAGDYLVCFPCGSPETKLKRWPVQNFADVLQRSQARWRLPVTLLGGDGERDELQDVADQIGGARIIAGAPMAEAAHVLAHARFYLGNDTGPMHLAAAYGVPGVTIYGGGTWPHYAPWGPGSIGLVSPMPCFGCDWDCVFGQGVCVESVPVDEVSRAMDDVMRGPPAQAESRPWNGLDPMLLRIAQGTASKHRLLQDDRAKRLEAIYQLSRAEQGKAQSMVELELLANERLTALEKTREALLDITREAEARERGLHELTAVIEARDGHVVELELVASERLTSLEKTHEALLDITREAEARERGLRELTAVIEARDARVVELELVATERLTALETTRQALLDITREAAELEQQATSFEVAAAERLVALQEKDETLRRLSTELNAGLTVIRELEQQAGQLAHSIGELKSRTVQLEFERDEAALKAEAQLNQLRAFEVEGWRDYFRRRYLRRRSRSG